MKVRYGFLPIACLALLLQMPLFQAYSDGPAVLNNQGVSFPTQAQLGNIFVVGDKVQIQAAVSNGTTVDWEVTDYQGQKVANGTADVTNGTTSIAPGDKGLGLFLMKITANANGSSVGEGTTSYAVIPKIDNSKMPDARFGIASHFGKFMQSDMAPLLAKAGVTSARDSLDWSWIETTPDKYDFTVHTFDQRVAELDKNNINTVFTCCFGNSLHYDDPSIQSYCAAPHTQSQYDAYTKLCLAHLTQFGSKVKALEIWNEYNGSFCAGAAAQDRPKYYTEMLKDAYTAIKAERPDVQVLGGALNGIPLPYAEKLFQDGALDYMDGIVIHNYGGDPAIVEDQMHQLVDLMKKYNNGQAKPIWITEFGDWDDKTVVRAEAAARLTKMYAMFMNQPEEACAYWYLARDYPEEGFPTMGLIHKADDPMGKYTPTANYVAYATMANQLYGAKPKGEEASDIRTHLYHFERNGAGIWVCWAEVGTTSVVFQTKSPLREVNMVGGETKLTPVNGQVTLNLTGEPVYLIADRATDVALVKETPRPDQIVADAATGFSGEQGRNGWSYNMYTSNGDGTSAYDPKDAQPMTQGVVPGDWGYNWNGPGNWYTITADQTSPSSADGKQLWTVRRWTSTVDGDLHLTGEVTRGDNGDGIGVKIFVDGQQVYSKLVPPKGDEKIEQNITVKKGSLVDFAVTPGPGTDNSYDATGFKMTIVTVPK